MEMQPADHERRTPSRTITPQSRPVIGGMGLLRFPYHQDELRQLVRTALDEDDAFNDLTTIATVVSDRGVVEEGRPIVYAMHDADDGSWAFLSSPEPRIVDGRLIGLAALLAIEPGLRELADLEPGWAAERDYRSGPWHRRPPDDREAD